MIGYQRTSCKTSKRFFSYKKESFRLYF
jgi:hypothetical protein